jgi:transposase-like protein
MTTEKQPPMNPQEVFCPHTPCVTRGQIGKGNIHVHSQKERRYICDVCGKTFVETKGTPFYRKHKAREEQVRVSTLLAYGCPIPAIVVAFGWDERTVRQHQNAAGAHCQAVHEYVVEQPRDLGQVQADEIRVTAQGMLLWLAMAVEVSTRLWLGAEVSVARDHQLLRALLRHVKACALCRPVLLCVDGLAAYLSAIWFVFREPVSNGKGKRPHMRPWDGLHIGQIVKRSRDAWEGGIVRQVVQGSVAQVQALLSRTQGGGVLNTAYIERLNATFRMRLAALGRRCRTPVRQVTTLQRSVYLVGAVYNFCTYHDSLRLEFALPNGRRRWLHRTPANAALLTDHKWSVAELLWFKVPQAPVLPKRRGRYSNAFLELKKQWLG